MVVRLRPNFLASLFGVIIAAGGIVVVSAYLLDWQFLLVAISQPIPIRFLGAICFTMLGISVYSASRGGKRGHMLCFAAGLAMLIVSAFTIVDIFSRDIGIGEPPMSLGASLSFAAYAIALIMVRRGPRAVWISQGAAMAGFIFAMVAVIGHLYDIPSLYSTKLLGTTGVVSALLALMGGMGILFIERNEGFSGLFFSSSVAGASLRAMVPAVVLAPLIIGLVAVQGSKTGVYERGTGIAFATLSTIVVFGLLAWRNAGAIANWERRLGQANEDIRLMATILETDRAAIIRVDAQGEIASWNGAAEDIYGYTALEAIGKPIAIVEGEDSVPLPAPTAHGRVDTADINRRTKAGGLVEVSVSRYPIRDTAGLLLGYADVSRNMNEIRRLERYSHTMFEASPVPKIVFGPDRQVRSVNPACAELFGYDREEMIGAPYDALISDQVQDSTLDGRTDQIGHRRDGSVFLARISHNGFRVGKEELTIAIIIDVTRERQMEKETVRSQRLQGIAMFAGTLTHEFNNYLTTILGNAALVMSEVDPHSDAFEYCSRIESVGQRAASLARRVLQFSRMEAPEAEIGSLRALAQETVAMARTTILSGWDVSVESPPSLWAAPFDSAQAEQALMNLLKNSAEQCTRGRVSITLSNEVVDANHQHSSLGRGRYVRMSVRDNCGGLPPEAADRLFEPFFTNKASGRGTGLGLSVVDGILKAHGGFASIENAAGEGLTVHLYFPAAESEGEPIPDSALDHGQLELAID